ncbi:MAG: DUF1501 domain-containing protein [Gammaproteobacteria bacterium]|nr:DUF1501 domain-containing protein [Gammaproteobacteria bacterium]
MTGSNIAAHPTIPTDRDILVCIFQRGAADGLNALAPYSDGDYYGHRPTIGLAAPGNPNGAIYVNDDYALHPSLAPLKPIYDAGDLALVHATGMPHQIRSHFSAQNLIERGVVEKTGPSTGWLGRHLASSAPASSSAFRAISISGNVPAALNGALQPLAIDNLNDFEFDQDIIDSGYPRVLTDLFQSAVPFSAAANAALSAMDELQAADLASITPDNDAVYPANSALAAKMLQAAQLIKSNIPVEVICLDSDGWDHHESLPTYIDISLTELAGVLDAFYTDMGAGMARITVLVYTEFGRRIAENGSLGTDHGTGSLAYLMGGGVNGGQVISDWPGLNIGVNEDLQITTDLRTVISEMLDKRLGGADVGNLFPGFTGATSVNAFLG